MKNKTEIKPRDPFTHTAGQAFWYALAAVPTALFGVPILALVNQEIVGRENYPAAILIALVAGLGIAHLAGRSLRDYYNRPTKGD